MHIKNQPCPARSWELFRQALSPPKRQVFFQPGLGPNYFAVSQEILRSGTKVNVLESDIMVPGTRHEDGFMGRVHCHCELAASPMGGLLLRLPRPRQDLPRSRAKSVHVAPAITSKCNYGFTRCMQHIYASFPPSVRLGPVAVGLHFN